MERMPKDKRLHWYIPKDYSREKNLINVTREEVTFILADQMQWLRPTCSGFQAKSTVYLGK